MTARTDECDDLHTQRLHHVQGWTHVDAGRHGRASLAAAITVIGEFLSAHLD